ncbi:MAG: cyclic nucleotide-binding domain-containing protein [Verrucomicrobiales bacterium]|nr:cyclic nucleotide-binding domain-containing protein [Verrucomicrobiales bacterium]
MSRVLELCEDLPVKQVLAGENLMTQGGTNLQMAVMKSGKVEVVRDHQQIAVVDEVGSIFGEMAVILRTKHSASVSALMTSEFYIIEDPYSFLWERAEFNFELLNILARRLEQMDRQFASVIHYAETEHDAVEMVESMIEGIVNREPGSE